MKLFLFVLDAIGFTGILIAAVAASIASSCARLTLNCLMKLLEEIGKFLRRMRSKMPAIISRTRKNGTEWLVIKVGKFSILLGRKDAIKPE